MSLTGILNIASAGISNSDYQIALANANIANASDTSYSRKTASFTSITETRALSDATVTRVADAYLTKAAATANAASSHDAAISDALQSYDAALGTVGGSNDVSSLLTSLETSITSLKSAGATAAAKADVVSHASSLATAIRSLSGTIQGLRNQANSDIATTVSSINTSLDKVSSLNDQIASTTAAGGDTATLEDQRDAALQSLSAALGVSYFTTPDNKVQVYAPGGQLLVGASANHLSYSASTAIGPGATYPGGIAGITLGGTDITTSLTGGKIGGLIDLRDNTLVGEQAKLDQLASTLISTANTATNSGTAYPPPTSLTSAGTVSASDAFSATGTLRVAVVGSDGTVTASQDIDLSTMTSVSDLVGALNGVPGLSASISASGNLVVSATAAGTGVALADVGAQVSPSGQGVSAYFGFNDLFSGTDATNVAVNSRLQADASGLPTSALPTTGTLTAGAVALASGDSAVADRLSTAFSTPTAFAAAGNFGAQSVSLDTYASTYVAGASTLVSNASDTADASKATYTAATTRLQNLTSVNTDEELASLTTYQQQYQANAQMISVVRNLFDALIQMMN